MASTDFINQVDQALAYQIGEFINNNPKSGDAIKDAKDTLPSGTTRAVLVHRPHPLVFQGERECYLTSLDGREYLDFVSEYCAGMFGHSNPEIINAIVYATKTGFMLGGPTLAEQELAKRLVSRFPSTDAIRFCNSGTEANTLALATALAYTGRKKFVYGRFNDIEHTRTKIDIKVAVIIVEPMQGAGGMIPATREFLRFLRDEATRVGAVLIFDEVMASRAYYGGLQEYHGIIPDMTTIGKHFGGGCPFGAFGGRMEIFELFNPESSQYLFHFGTFNNNQFSMNAGIAAVQLMSREAIDNLNKLGDALRVGMKSIFEGKRPGTVVIRGFGSTIGLAFQGSEGIKLRDLFYFYLLNNGIYSGQRGSFVLCLEHRQDHLDRVLEVTRNFCAEYL